jgi:hypothetical protein
MCGDGFGGGGADGRHVQCGSDAVDKLDAGYIREGGSEGMMEQGGLDWSEGMQVSAWLAGVCACAWWCGGGWWVVQRWRSS